MATFTVSFALQNTFTTQVEAEDEMDAYETAYQELIEDASTVVATHSIIKGDD